MTKQWFEITLKVSFSILRAKLATFLNTKSLKKCLTTFFKSRDSILSKSTVIEIRLRNEMRHFGWSVYRSNLFLLRMSEDIRF